MLKYYQGGYMNTLICFFKSFGLLLLDSFLTLFISSIFPNDALAYLLANIILCIFFIFIYHKRIIHDFKNIKLSNLKTLIISFIFIILAIIIHTLLVNILKSDALNETTTRELIKLYPSLFIPNVILFGSFKEEIIYRLQYNKSLSNIVISTLFFTIIHVSFNSINELFFFIPYLLISISFSITYFKTDNIILSTLIHILNNFINIMLLFI